MKTNNAILNVNDIKVTNVRKQIYTAIAGTIVNLYERWSDEKKYEDFKDYEDALRKSFNKIKPDEATFIGATKRPFGIKYDIKVNDAVIHLHLYVKKNGNYLQFFTKVLDK